MANYANVYVLDAIKRVNGAGQSQVYYDMSDQAMRIWMNPDRMASLWITTSDIQRAVADQNALYGAAQITGTAAPGYSSGDAIQAMEETAREMLPTGYEFAWSGMAFEEKKAGATSTAAFIFSLVIVFLVLAAQFESWTLPGSVMTAVPFGILGAFVFNWLRGLQNDVYFQIGLLVLIGLGAKNAVLRVTFAVELRREGLSIMDATIKAGEERLRPIIMTSLAFIFGVLPLVIATGAGANARHSIGTGIIGGMIGETTLAMLYVPLFSIFSTGRPSDRGKQIQVRRQESRLTDILQVFYPTAHLCHRQRYRFPLPFRASKPYRPIALDLRVFFHFSSVEFRLRSQRPDQPHPDITPFDDFLLCGLFSFQTVFDGNESAGLVSKLFDLDPGLVTRPGRCPDTVQARSVLCCWAERKFGISTIELSRRPGISQPTDSQSVKRG